MRKSFQNEVQNKIQPLEHAVHQRKRWSAQNKKVVFTNGVFDIVHAGHVQSLMAARDCGDYLIVGLNADASVQQLKGSTRPVINQSNRALLLASFVFVDMVILFEEDTPIQLIQALLPNVLVKSADYTAKDIVGAKEVIENGGEVKIMPYVEGLSTTAIINKIKTDPHT